MSSSSCLVRAREIAWMGRGEGVRSCRVNSVYI